VPPANNNQFEWNSPTTHAQPYTQVAFGGGGGARHAHEQSETYYSHSQQQYAHVQVYPHYTIQIPSANGSPPQHVHSPELADLGLSARDSRLDERWTSFMRESGLLDGDTGMSYRAG
jgi:hypothetical protein